MRLSDYACLHERLFSEVSDEDIINSSRVINCYEQRNKQVNDLDEVLRLIFGQSECWHALLERHCSNHMEPPTMSSTMCGGVCPHCLNIRK